MVLPYSMMCVHIGVDAVWGCIKFRFETGQSSAVWTSIAGENNSLIRVDGMQSYSGCNPTQDTIRVGWMHIADAIQLWPHALDATQLCMQWLMEIVPDSEIIGVKPTCPCMTVAAVSLHFTGLAFRPWVLFIQSLHTVLASDDRYPTGILVDPGGCWPLRTHHRGNLLPHTSHRGNWFPHTSHRGNWFPQTSRRGNWFPHFTHRKNWYPHTRLGANWAPHTNHREHWPSHTPDSPERVQTSLYHIPCLADILTSFSGGCNRL